MTKKIPLTPDQFNYLCDMIEDVKAEVKDYIRLSSQLEINPTDSEALQLIVDVAESLKEE